jgi:predicted ABC-type transport system involved in lysophospholipase L1 biosynthesis ATPase subunit
MTAGAVTSACPYRAGAGGPTRPAGRRRTTARLDPTTAAGICGLLLELTDAGTAIVIASHDRARLASLADRLIRLTGEDLTEE